MDTVKEQANDIYLCLLWAAGEKERARYQMIKDGQREEVSAWKTFKRFNDNSLNWEKNSTKFA